MSASAATFSRILTLLVAVLICPSAARAIDPFEIQVYDATVNQPGRPALELHLNSVISGRRDAVPPELPAHHQSHFTAEPAFGITDWWEVGMYVQTALLADGTFEYAGTKLRTKLVVPGRPESRLRWGVNVEVSRLPDRYERDVWGGEIRPIGTWSSAGGAWYVSVNPIVDLSFARLEAPSFEPATTILYVVGGLLSAGIEYYANLGPVGGWLPPGEQEHYLFEVINVLAWKHVRLNVGVGEGLTGASNDFVGKMIVGFR